MGRYTSMTKGRVEVCLNAGGGEGSAGAWPAHRGTEGGGSCVAGVQRRVVGGTRPGWDS